MTIFDYLNALIFKKEHFDLNLDDDSQFSLFMVNRWVSFYSPEISAYVNGTSNKYSQLFTTKQEQFDYLYNVLPTLRFKRLAYVKKTKKEKDTEEQQYIPEFMSKREYDRNVEFAESLSK